MKHTIVPMKQKIEILDENNKKISLTGYAFIDDWGFCIMIVYGEKKKELLTKYLSESNMPL